MTNQEELVQRKIKRPPLIPYLLLGYVWKMIYFRKLGVEVECRIDMKQYRRTPLVMISNHASRLDYIYTGLACLPMRFNFVAGYNEFFRSHLAFIFRLLQIIPKKNFVADMYSMKSIRSIIKSGGKVCLYPEGMSSISGANQPVCAGTGKFLKKLGVPVLMTRISGGYLTSTKYCLEERPGKVHVIVDCLFTAGQLEKMSDQEIQDSINTAIRNDDYQWNSKVGAEFSCGGKVAENLHTLLYKCPVCGAEFHMEGKGNSISCSVCGNGAILDDRYVMTSIRKGCRIPSTPRDWLDWQRHEVRKEIADPSFCLVEKVRLGNIPSDHFLKDQKTSEIVGEGVLTLNRDGLAYKGTRNGEAFEFFIDSRSLPTYGMCTDISRFYTFYKGEFMEFYPEHSTVEKWFLATEEIHRMNEGPWRDFVDAEEREKVSWTAF